MKPNKGQRMARAVYGQPNRVCQKCGETKPVEEFKPNAFCIDGFTHKCMVCHRNYHAAGQRIRKLKKKNEQMVASGV